MKRFSNRVLTSFAKLSHGIFDRPLYEKSRVSDFRKTQHEHYSWVEQGDVLEIMKVKPSRFKDPQPIHIRSPVTGLAISSSVFDDYAKILLPEGESVPSNASEYLYSELCDFCERHQEYIFGEAQKRPAKRY